jgi:hypothetical protein
LKYEALMLTSRITLWYYKNNVSRIQGKSRTEDYYFAKWKHKVVPLVGSRNKSYIVALYYIEISTKIIVFPLKFP